MSGREPTERWVLFFNRERMLSIAPLALLFVAAGATHFTVPRFYLKIMPPWIARPRFWVAFTGACEIAGGIGLLLESTRAAAGWALCALLVAVFPANIQMLRQEWPEASALKRAALAARLPLQLPLIYWVYVAALRR